MAFIYQAIKEQSFDSLKELTNSLHQEGNYIVRIPLKGLLDYGASFVDDEYFGIGDTVFKINDKAIRAFCSALGMRFETLQLLERKNLASDVLNDILAQCGIKDKLQSYDIVVNEESNEIIGLVSTSYIGYSNYEFLQDINNLLSLNDAQINLFNDGNDDFTFEEALLINTQLSLRFSMNKKVGVIKGIGGKWDDITKLGFQFKNSMVGDSSVNINFFLHRMICANGLVVPAGVSVNRIFHSGKKESFNNRLDRAFKEITNRIGYAGNMIKSLGDIPFDPMALAKMKISDMIFDIIPSSKKDIIASFKIANTSNGADKISKSHIEREAQIIGKIPKMYGGEYSSRVFNSKYRDNNSMFDFINIFTEYAKTLPLSKKLETEEKAGILADWIAQNKRKFKKSS